MNIQSSVVAGMFYPADPDELTDLLQTFFAQIPKEYTKIPKAIIAPHAGYIYSGLTAAFAFACLKNLQQKLKRVIVIAPSHRHPFHGIAISSADFFQTPLGKISVDRETLKKLAKFPQVLELDIAFASEHALEVELPFLQTQLQDFQLIPLLAGDASADEVCKVLENLWEDKSTLIVASSDLSHYHPYNVAQKLDLKTIHKMLALDYENLHGEEACGYIGVRGLLKMAKNNHWHAHLIDLRNSGDTAGDKNQVVGYGAIHFYE